MPAPISSLVGRTVELDAITMLLQRHRLVTMVGPGGVGKTRLAQHIALNQACPPNQVTWWVELAGVSDPERVEEAVARSIGTIVRGSVDGADVIVPWIRAAGPTLLVLDNAEHLLDRVATLVDTVLSRCPELRVLTTSRAPLGVSGETLFEVPSLSLPPPDALWPGVDLGAFDATRLFLERARQVRPNFTVDEHTAPAVIELCHRLDGLPLAIELGAARVRTMPLDRLRDGLREALSLLSDGPRTAPARHQTLLQSIHWSVDLLEAPERTVLARLAVLSAPFTLAAAEAVAADGEIVGRHDVVGLLGRLVDRSLVCFDGRYRLLETIREFARSELEERHEIDDARLRHARHYAAHFGAHAAGDSGEHHDEMLADMTDAVAALEWSFDHAPDVACQLATALTDTLLPMGTLAAERLVDWLVAAAPAPAPVAPAAWAAAVAAQVLNAFVDDRQDLLAMVPLARSRLDPEDDLSRWCLAFADAAPGLLQAQPEPAERVLRELVERDRYPALQRTIACGVALVRAYQGEWDIAERHLDHARHLLQRSGLPFRQDIMEHGYSAVQALAMFRGDLASSLQLIKDKPAVPNHAITAFAGLGALAAYQTGRFDEMAELRRWAQLAAPTLQQGTLAALRALTALVEGDDAAATDHALTAWALARRNGVLQGSILPLTVALALRTGRLDDARTVLEGFGSDIERLGEPPWHRAQWEHCAAMVALADGDDERAWVAAHRQLEAARAGGFPLIAIDALSQLAELAERRGNRVLAASLAGAERAARERSGYLVPVLVHPDEVAARAERLASQQPDAFAHGGSLDLSEAITAAQRMRGGRARPATGWASLTPTQHQVATLAAAGTSNAAIAERLFMSIATVKTHLTQVYAKLAITNRTELAHLAATEPHQV